MKRLIFIIILAIHIVSCNDDRELQTALCLAGENRLELKRVLDHYSENPEDSLKYRAAEFLIKNMPGHYTIESNKMNAFRKIFDNDTAGSYFSRKCLDISLPFFTVNTNIPKREDIMNITSDFLIHHIDAVFEQLNQYPWLENIPFDMFLEYLLPYRLMQERLDFWRDSLQLDNRQLEIIRHCDDIKYIPSKISSFSLPNMRLMHHKAFINLIAEVSTSGDCYGLSMQELLKCRAMGIPSCVDFIPFYGNRNGYHYWVTYIYSEENIPMMRYTSERKVPKVFRHTFSCNNQYKGMKGEYIPDLFQDPFIRDVTNLYTNTQNISIHNVRKLHTRPNYAYLCVFNNLDWQPTAIGEYGSKSVCFKHMGNDMVYLPIAYNVRQMVPLNYPFILRRNEKIEHLVPDTTVRQELFLTRKYPNTMSINNFIEQVNGSCWLASNDPNLVNADTVFTYYASNNRNETTNKYSNTLPPYRYWKFLPGRQSLALSEFRFFNQSGQRLNIRDHPVKALFDDNMLSNAIVDKSFIVDLEQKTPIEKIICIPRTDGNGIIPGNNYELLYYNLEGWQSLGHQIAEHCWLKYDNAPIGALFWLRNHTTGVEERIFTVKNGNIRFW